MENVFGPHLMMDLSGCPKDILNDLKIHFDFLNELPIIIGMTKITQPYVFPYLDPSIPEDCGITGMVIIAESHLTVHSFQEKGFVFIDIFSCKPFNTSIAEEEIIKRFKPCSYEKHLSLRGKNFPRYNQISTIRDTSCEH